MSTARSSRGSRFSLVLVAVVALGDARASAHRLDELLQQAWLSLAPDRLGVELSLTPGIAIADAVIAAIDQDRDGVLSAKEQRAYASSAVQAMTLHLDDVAVAGLQRTDVRFPTLDALREGSGSISIRAEARVPLLEPGAHRVLFRNESAHEGSVYLANVLVPESRSLAVTGQYRTADQREFTVALNVQEGERSSALWWFVAFGALVPAAWLIRRWKAPPPRPRSTQRGALQDPDPSRAWRASR